MCGHVLIFDGRVQKSIFALDVFYSVGVTCSVMDLTTLGGRLGFLVDLGGIRLSDVDALASLADGHAGKVRHGHVRRPSYETLLRLAAVFGVSIGWLADGDEKTAPSRRTVLAAVGKARGGAEIPTVRERRVRRAHEAGGLKHSAKVPARTGVRKGVTRSAGVTRRS